MLLLAHSTVAFVLLHLLLLSHAPFITHSGNIPTVPCLCWRSFRHADSSIRCYHRSTDSTRSSLRCPLSAVSYDSWIFVCSYSLWETTPVLLLDRLLILTLPPWISSSFSSSIMSLEWNGNSIAYHSTAYHLLLICTPCCRSSNILLLIAMVFCCYRRTFAQTYLVFIDLLAMGMADKIDSRLLIDTWSLVNKK